MTAGKDQGSREAKQQPPLDYPAVRPGGSGLTVDEPERAEQRRGRSRLPLALAVTIPLFAAIGVGAALLLAPGGNGVTSTQADKRAPAARKPSPPPGGTAITPSGASSEGETSSGGDAPSGTGGASPTGSDIRFQEQFYGGGIPESQLEQDGNTPQARPLYIKLGSGETWTIAGWKGWGGQTATASGTYRDHTDYTSPGTVTLSNPRQCGSYRMYTVMRVSYVAASPAGYPRRNGPYRMNCG